MANHFMLFIALIVVLATALSAVNGSHRHVLIHVPVHVKHHHHTHTIFKHIKHPPEIKYVGYEVSGHGHGHGWGSGGSSGGWGGSGLDLHGGYSSYEPSDWASYESNHYGGGGGWEDDK